MAVRLFARRPANGLDLLRIASPCPARWEDMEGDDRVRRCERCAQDVYDSTGLTSDELRALIERRAGRVCLRLHRRLDGRLLTRDCPIGVRWFYARLSAVATLLLSAVGCSSLFTTVGSPERLVVEPSIPTAKHTSPELAGDPGASGPPATLRYTTMPDALLGLDRLQSAVEAIHREPPR